MVAFKSRFWAAFDLPICLEEDACFEEDECFETIVCFEAVAYFEAAACCETAFDAAEVEAFDAAEAEAFDAAEVEAFDAADADNADGSNVEPPNERDKPWADAKFSDKTDTDDAETATVFACAATAPNDAAPMPTNPASEAATNRSDLDRPGE